MTKAIAFAIAPPKEEVAYITCRCGEIICSLSDSHFIQSKCRGRALIVRPAIAVRYYRVPAPPKSPKFVVGGLACVLCETKCGNFTVDLNDAGKQWMKIELICLKFINIRLFILFCNEIYSFFLLISFFY